MAAKKPLGQRVREARNTLRGLRKRWLPKAIRRRKKAKSKRVKARRREVVRALKARVKKATKRVKALAKKLRRQKPKGAPHIVYTRISPNRSSRGGVSPRLIVLHSTESDPRSLRAIVDYFAGSGAQASSHIVTDADGNSGRSVPDSDKAWTQAYFNPWSLSIEQCGRASQSSWPDAQVEAAARWIAYWSRKYGIPIQRGAVSGSSVTRSGVVTHAQLGSAGGGHHDPGAGFPFDRCLALARKYR